MGGGKQVVSSSSLEKTIPERIKSQKQEPFDPFMFDKYMLLAIVLFFLVMIVLPIIGTWLFT